MLGSHFHIKPLLPFVEDAAPFSLLTISASHNVHRESKPANPSTVQEPLLGEHRLRAAATRRLNNIGRNLIVVRAGCGSAPTLPGASRPSWLSSKPGEHASLAQSDIRISSPNLPMSGQFLGAVASAMSCENGRLGGSDSMAPTTGAGD